jgi:chorismate mutase
MAQERGHGSGRGGAGVKDIDDLRQRIDALDEQIVRLLNERAACALEIGTLKQRVGMQIYQPSREVEVLRHVQACTTAMGGPLSPAALARLFERIIDEARRLERESAGRHDEREADVLGGRQRRAGAY